MTKKSDVIEYMNLFAYALKIVHEMKCVLRVEYAAIQFYERYEGELKRKLDQIWHNTDDNQDLFSELREVMDSLEKNSENEEKYVKFVELCKWLDSKITYGNREYNEDGKRVSFSMEALVCLEKNQIVEIGSLNSNVEETKIWICPKFETYPVFIDRDGKKEESKYSNRDAFFGLNGEFKGVSYFIEDYEKNIVVKNIILNKFHLKNKTELRVFFAPVSDRKDLLIEDSNPVTVKRHEVSENGISIIGLNNVDEINNRLLADWKLACEKETDIFFAPEMLGTEQICELEEGEAYNKMITEYLMKEHTCEVPYLTFLPSRWQDGHNVIDIVDNEGYVRKYEKMIPFVDKKRHLVEALQEQNEMELLVFHIPGCHRITVLICAEFIDSDPPEIKKYICERLQPTLMIVPSYTRGETDFMNDIHSVDRYGTTVIWGNCCGAAADKDRVIGGVSQIGNNGVEYFSEQCVCRFHCRNIKACGFLIKIPLIVEKKKSRKKSNINMVEHIVSKA